MDFGNEIIKLRKNKKISQEELAELLGVTRQTISNWELNITQPNISQVKRLSQIFNISIDELLDNNIRDILEKKISNTENLAKITGKNLKIIGITLYFIILSLLIGIIIYYSTNKNFTDDYQTEFSCFLEDNSYNFSMIADSEYTIEIALCNTKDSKSNGCHIETYKAGSSLSEAMDSLKDAKKIFINKGATCK